MVIGTVGDGNVPLLSTRTRGRSTVFTDFPRSTAEVEVLSATGNRANNGSELLLVSIERLGSDETDEASI